MSDTHFDAWHIVGDDGLEYGPVPVETMHRWVDEGRVVGDTRVRRGEGEWTRAASHPALAGLFDGAGGSGEPPVPEAGGGAHGVPVPAGSAVARLPREFEALEFYREAWRGLRAEDIALMGVVLFVLHVLSNLPWGLGFVASILSMPVILGLSRATLGRLRGEPVQFKTILSGFDRTGTAVVAGIVMTILLAVGYAFLILPGLWLSVLWTFTFPILAETQQGPFEAMGSSCRLSEGERWGLLRMLLLSFCFMLLGFLALVVGFYVAMPVIFTANALAYRWMQRRTRSG
jgi:hypothetical protein